MHKEDIYGDTHDTDVDQGGVERGLKSVTWLSGPCIVCRRTRHDE